MEDPREVPNDHEGNATPPVGGEWVPGSSAEPPNPPPAQSWPPPPSEGYGRWGAPGEGWPSQPGAGQFGGGPQAGSPYGFGQESENPYGGGSYGGGPYGGGQWGGPAGAGGSGGPWSNPWPAPEPPRPRRTLPGAITALLLVVAILVGLGLGHSVWRANTSNPSSSGGAFTPGNGLTPFNGNGGFNPGSGSGGAGSGSGSSSSGSGGPSNVGSIAAKASPGLVDIDTTLSYQNDEAAGTGIVLTSDGVVLTNNHVIAGATQVKATDVGNGHTYAATVVGYDRAHDIAVLQLQGARNLTTATIGDSSKVAVGDQVVGLGNAGGVGGAPSSAGGSVTGLNQSITATDESDGSSEQLSGLIQVDADIQPGDSGGALVDTQGRVVGVDTAASAGFSFRASGGQGFAIPINQATGIADQIQGGQATDTVHIGPTAFLGVLINPGNNNTSGANLARAVAGGPAAQAGLAAGDTIRSLNGQTVSSPSTLTQLISKYHPGDKVLVGWTDGSGQSHQATVTLATGPAQ